MSGLLERCDRLPPYLVRLVARSASKRGVPLTLHQIAAASGIPYRTVRRLSRQRSWGNVPIATADKFAAACGVNLMKQKAQLDYLKRLFSNGSGFNKRFKKPGWQRSYWVKLIAGNKD